MTIIFTNIVTIIYNNITVKVFFFSFSFLEISQWLPLFHLPTSCLVPSVLSLLSSLSSLVHQIQNSQAGLHRGETQCPKQQWWFRTMVSNTCSPPPGPPSFPRGLGHALPAQSSPIGTVCWMCARGVGHTGPGGEGGWTHHQRYRDRRGGGGSSPRWHAHLISPFGEPSGTIGHISGFYGWHRLLCSVVLPHKLCCPTNVIRL